MQTDRRDGSIAAIFLVVRNVCIAWKRATFFQWIRMHPLVAAPRCFLPSSAPALRI